MERIILASGSPRRKEILERYGLNIMVVKSDITEKINQGETPQQISMSLAFNKAYSVSKAFTGDIIIGADTIVVYENKILGKPKNDEEAFKMLSMLNGNVHDVITGISIIKAGTNQKIIDYEITKVKFKNLTQSRILKYIESKESFDKAGAYGIQGLGAILVEKIDGCYSNVVGLPLSKIDNLLGRYFNYNIL
jgi:septum formation protein